MVHLPPKLLASRYRCSRLFFHRTTQQRFPNVHKYNRKRMLSIGIGRAPSKSCPHTAHTPCKGTQRAGTRPAPTGCPKRPKKNGQVQNLIPGRHKACPYRMTTRLTDGRPMHESLRNPSNRGRIIVAACFSVQAIGVGIYVAYGVFFNPADGSVRLVQRRHFRRVVRGVSDHGAVRRIRGAAQRPVRAEDPHDRHGDLSRSWVHAHVRVV